MIGKLSVTCHDLTSPLFGPTTWFAREHILHIKTGASMYSFKKQTYTSAKLTYYSLVHENQV